MKVVTLKNIIVLSREVGFYPTLKYVFTKQPKFLFYEPHIRKYFKPMRDKCFVDVGANRGQHVVPLAQNYKWIYAFEPSPQAFEELVLNAWNIKNATFFNVALGSEKTFLPLNISRLSDNDSLVFQPVGYYTGQQLAVQVVPLDAYTFPDPIGIIKLDTEGYEVPVLKGALKTIAEHKPRLIIEVHGFPPTRDEERIRTLLPQYKWIRVLHAPDNPNETIHLIGDAKIE